MRCGFSRTLVANEHENNEVWVKDHRPRQEDSSSKLMFSSQGQNMGIRIQAVNLGNTDRHG